jgi:subtilisin family serine protease
MQLQRDKTKHIQNQIITEIERKGRKPGRIHKYKYTPYIAMTVDTETLDAIFASPDIVNVEEDFLVPLAVDLNWSIDRIGAIQLHDSSITGAGVAVAILDTGVDKTHPFLEGSVVSEACYSTNLCPVDLAPTDPGSAMPYGGSCPFGECDHGTHVAGIVAGRRGVVDSPGPGAAPEAGIIAIQVFSLSGSDMGAWNSDIKKGLERVYELRNTFNIASVNMSLGGGLYSGTCNSSDAGYTPALKASIDNLREAGIATVIASGNNGSCGAISYPACISSAISVGATTDSDAVASFSNSASFLSLLAPGLWITSSIPGSGYATWGGTSMATPHVAGAWALMKQVNPLATVDTILNLFTSTGMGVKDTKLGCTSVTKKRIDVFEAAGLTVTKRGLGTGTVTSVPSGIDCGEYCGEQFPENTLVTLTATADAGSEFGGWSGEGCSGTDTCVVTFSPGTSVTALFRKEVTIGTEFVIYGSAFGTKKGKVLIGDVAAKIAKDGWAKNAIAVTVSKVPDGSPSTFPVTVTPKGTASMPPYEDACAVKAPEIDSLEAVPVVATSVKINGRFFSTKKPKVYIEYVDKNNQTKRKSCKVTSYDMDKTTGASNLVFVVPKLPDGFVPGSQTLKIVNKVGTATIPFTVDI